VADNKNFGAPKILQFGDKTPGNLSGDSGHCSQCEAMLADALDGTLSAADQEFFDTHMANCEPCAQSFADARRGIAFLEMLRHPQPEPPAALLERILAQTSGDPRHAAPAGMQHAGLQGATVALPPEAFGVPGLAPGYTIAASGNVLPFRQRMVAAMRTSSLGHIVFQPRLAMTAAMAFFSIALTLNLTGVRLQDLHASDLRPSSLKRSFYSANARVVQYYEGLRVVYELESRVHDLQSASENDAAAGSQTAPTSAQPASSQPDGQAHPDGTKPAKPDPAAKPEQKQQPPPTGPASRQMPPTGTSHREGIRQTLSLAALTSGCELNPLTSSVMSAITATPAYNGVEGSLV
jgi:hypothetical protein